MKNQTLKNLFLNKKDYIITIDIDNNNYIFCEGLNEYGESINNEVFNINNIKNLCLELFTNNEYVETIDNLNITINTTINDLIKK